MNVTTIEMDIEVAKEKLDAYRRALESRHSEVVDEEWRAAERAYSKLAKGTPLIDAAAAIRESGWRDDACPRLAISRADQRYVQFSIARHSGRWTAERGLYGPYAPMSWTFESRKERRRGNDKQRARNLTVTVEDITVEPPTGWRSSRSKVAMVPMVPPDVLPRADCDLSKHYILWEVENWEVAPPIDPILLKPIGGNLYAVVAQWDLTELERVIIAGTRR